MSLEKSIYYLTAFFCSLGVLAHEFIGAPSFLPPLSNTELTDEAIWILHFSWHSGTVAMTGLVLLFLYAARNQGNYPVAAIASVTMSGFAIVCIALAQFGNEVLWLTPAPYLWTSISMLGISGVIIEKNNRKKEINNLFQRG